MAGVRLNTGGGFSDGFKGGFGMMGDMLNRRRELEVAEMKARSADAPNPKTQAEAARISAENIYGMPEANVDKVVADTKSANATAESTQNEMRRKNNLHSFGLAEKALDNVSKAEELRRKNNLHSSELAEKALDNVGKAEDIKKKRLNNKELTLTLDSKIAKANAENGKGTAEANAATSQILFTEFYALAQTAHTPEELLELAKTFDKVAAANGMPVKNPFSRSLDGDRSRGLQKLKQVYKKFAELDSSEVYSKGAPYTPMTGKYMGKELTGWRAQDAYLEDLKRDAVDGFNLAYRDELQKGDGKNKRINDIIEDGNGGYMFALSVEDDEAPWGERSSPLTVHRSSDPKDSARLYDVNFILDKIGGDIIVDEWMQSIQKNMDARGYTPASDRSDEYYSALAEYDKSQTDRLKALISTDTPIDVVNNLRDELALEREEFIDQMQVHYGMVESPERSGYSFGILNNEAEAQANSEPPPPQGYQGSLPRPLGLPSENTKSPRRERTKPPATVNEDRFLSEVAGVTEQELKVWNIPGKKDDKKLRIKGELEKAAEALRQDEMARRRSERRRFSSDPRHMYEKVEPLQFYIDQLKQQYGLN